MALSSAAHRPLPGRRDAAFGLVHDEEDQSGAACARNPRGGFEAKWGEAVAPGGGSGTAMQHAGRDEWPEHARARARKRKMVVR
jgi:hypothetical protein